MRAEGAALSTEGLWNKHSRCTEYDHLWKKKKKVIFKTVVFTLATLQSHFTDATLKCCNSLFELHVIGSPSAGTPYC